MMVSYLLFYRQLWLARIMPNWYTKELISTDSLTRHPHYRRLTKHYKYRRKAVTTLWKATGLFALIFPTPPLVVGATLFSTCLSFAILDESG